MTTSALSFDASLAKAMRLLHSTEPDATDQLKAMLDECLSHKKPPLNVIPKQPPPPTVKPVVSANIRHQPAPSQIVMVVDGGSICAVCK